MMANTNGRLVSFLGGACLFLAGLLVAGTLSVLRSDMVATKAATEVKDDLVARIEANNMRYDNLVKQMSEVSVELSRLATQIEMLREGK